jgi:simple sugar transport system substrate-binding protein
MRSKLTIVIFCITFLVGSLATADAASKPKKPKKRINPAYVQITDDPTLPRVLLIGDSISIGYTLPTRKLMAGKANVHRVPTNCGPTSRAMTNIEKWLGEKPWDVIHFNFGLHDLKWMDHGKRQIPPEQYRDNLNKLVIRLKKTKAKLIWANTTPVPAGCDKPVRKNEDAIIYNKIAKEVMDKHGVVIDDLYAFTLPQLKKIQRPANVHFTQVGNDVLAKKVAANIQVALKDTPKELKIAFITCAVGSNFFIPVKKGMNDAGKMLGVKCDFIGTKGVDLVKQAEMIRQAVKDGYDGIAISIIHPEAFDDAIKDAIEAGIPVVGFNVDDHATPNARLSSVNQRLYDSGKTLAQHLISNISANSHVLMTMHDKGVSALEDRLHGMQEILKKKNVRWTVLIPGNKAAHGADAILEALQKNPDIRIILGTGQADTEAAGRAIKKHYAGGEYWCAGFDLSEKTLQLINEGHIKCTVDQQPYVQGFYPVVQLTQYIRYGIMPSDIDAGASIIDKSNATKVIGWTKQNYR